MREIVRMGLIAMAGGIVGGLVVLLAIRPTNKTPLPQPSTSSEVVTAHRLQLLDPAGRTRAELAMSGDGAVGLFFFDTSGRNRLVLGLYSPAEKEDPFVVLNDKNQSAAGIFRLFGENGAPVVVLKNKGQDRSIYGLNAGSLEPFLVNYSSDGKKQALFGVF